MSEKTIFRTRLLIGLFVAGLVASNLLGGKIAILGRVDFSVGILAFPLTFLITDIIEEVLGKKAARQVIFIGLASMIFVSVITLIALKLPTAPRSYITGEEFNKIHGISLRFLVASITAFLVAQTHDVWAFNFWKEKTGGRWLWLRNNASTVVSQLIDSVLFMFIALWHLPEGLTGILPFLTRYNTSPKFTAAYLFTLLIPWWILKSVMALLDTPFIYLGVWWLRRDQAPPSPPG